MPRSAFSSHVVNSTSVAMISSTDSMVATRREMLSSISAFLRRFISEELLPAKAGAVRVAVPFADASLLAVLPLPFWASAFFSAALPLGADFPLAEGAAGAFARGLRRLRAGASADGSAGSSLRAICYPNSLPTLRNRSVSPTGPSVRDYRYGGLPIPVEIILARNARRVDIPMKSTPVWLTGLECFEFVAQCDDGIRELGLFVAGVALQVLDLLLVLAPDRLQLLPHVGDRVA